MMEYILEEIEEIIENVLKYLPMKDLNRFMVVNQKWYFTARRLKQKRRRITYTNFTSSHIECVDEQIRDYLNIISSEPNAIIAFISDKLNKSYIPVSTSEVRLPRSVKKEKISFHNYLKRQWPASSSYIEIISDGVIVSDKNAEVIQEYEHKEAAGILMFPKRPDIDIEIKLPSLKKQLFEDYAGSSNPDDSDDDDGGGGDNNVSNNYTHNSSDENYGKYKFEDDLSTTNYEGDKEENNTSLDSSTSDDYEGSNKIKDGNKEMVPKLILHFYDQIIDQMPRTFCKRYKCIVAGCHVDRISIGDLYTTSIAIIFRGLPNVQCASIVLNIFCRTSKAVESELKKFIPFLERTFEGRENSRNESSSSRLIAPSSQSQQFDVRKYSDKIIAFMFSCVARGAKFHKGKSSLESSVFKKLFPGVPLFGLFGYGEVGVNILNEQDLSSRVGGTDECQGSVDDNDEDNEFFNTNSTVFVLMTF